MESHVFGLAMVMPTVKVLPWNELFPAIPRVSEVHEADRAAFLEDGHRHVRADTEHPVLAVQIERLERRQGTSAPLSSDSLF